jgi:hypothetical protein
VAFTIELAIITYINTMHTKIIHLDLQFYKKNTMPQKKNLPSRDASGNFKEKYVII